MKSRTSYFDKTVLRKDITRFAPVWGLYLIGGLLAALTLAGNSGRYYHLARNLGQLIGPFGIISFGYAIVTAQMLFGDLFNTRLCNALHALPLRREGWFLTHCAAGLLFSLVPNLIFTLVLLPFLKSLWFTAFLWFLGMTMHYLFFFFLAVFCMTLTGNRFAAAAVYTIINFLSLIVMWFVAVLFEPLMYGVVIRGENFHLFSPVVALFQLEAFFNVIHMEGCSCGKNGHAILYDSDAECVYLFKGFQGFENAWIYLAILVALAAVFAIVALVLYRKRHLESAGDFMVFRPMHPVFSVVYTLCVGALLQMIGDLFEVPFILFLLIGLVIGHFTAQMLLNRTVRVFKKKNWLTLVLVIAAVLGSLGLVKADVFGITRWTPKAENVVSVKVGAGFQEEFSEYTNHAQFSDPESVENMIKVHKLLIDEGPAEDREEERFRNLTICYTLSNGREVYRQYRATKGGEADKTLDTLFYRNHRYVLHAQTLEELIQKVDYVETDGLEISGSRKDSLLAALWADGEAGTLSLNNDYRYEKEDFISYLHLRFQDRSYLYMELYSSNTNTIAWLQEELLSGVSDKELLSQTDYFLIGNTVLNWEDPQQMEIFCQIFSEEIGTIWSGRHKFGIYVDVHLYNGMIISYTVPEDTDLYNWIVTNLPVAAE